MESRYAEEFQVSTPKLAVVERSPAYVHDVQLEYYEDGYPKLPACLDRRLTEPAVITLGRKDGGHPSARPDWHDVFKVGSSLIGV